MARTEDAPKRHIDIATALQIQKGISDADLAVDFSVPDKDLTSVDAQGIRSRINKEGELAKGNIARTAALIHRVAPAAFGPIPVLVAKGDDWVDDTAEAI